jgi:hypothetical protein
MMKPRRPPRQDWNLGGKPGLLVFLLIQAVFIMWMTSSANNSNSSSAHHYESRHEQLKRSSAHHHESRHERLKRPKKGEEDVLALTSDGEISSKDKCISGYKFVPCNATMKEMRYEYFDCGPREKTVRELLNESERMLMRGLYHGIVGPGLSTVGGFPSFVSGFNVDVIDRQHKEHGRSVWAQQDVEKGTLVWDSNGQTTCFPEGYQFRQFILSLPRYLVCDGLAFSYMAVKFVETQEMDEYGTMKTKREEKVMVCTDTDAGAFMNSGEYDGHGANVGCPKGLSKKECEYGLKMYALRNIEKGEEFLCNYNSFWVPKGWKSVGL